MVHDETPLGEWRGNLQEREIAQLRDDISKIDRELVELMAKRKAVSEAVGNSKDDSPNHAVKDDSQASKVIDRAGERADEYDLDQDLVRTIFKLLVYMGAKNQFR